MNSSSRPPQAHGAEVQMNFLAATPPPPLHPNAGHSPLRREHAAQPPSLTTSLSGLQHHGLGLTYSPAPQSTTSLSSPFSLSAHSPYISSPGGATLASSPMASRLSVAHPTPYNPREWTASAEGRSPSVGAAHAPHARPPVAPAPPRQLASDEPPVGSPPPPYSPQRTATTDTSSGASTSATISPAETVSPAATYNTPLTAATAASPDVSSGHRYTSSRPLSLVISSDSPNAPWGASFPPPPPAGGRGGRSSSRGEKTKSVFNLSSLTGRSKQHSNNGSPVPSAIDNLHQSTSEALNRGGETSMHPLAARRSASASAVRSAAGPSRPASRPNSPSKQSWEPGMPLPGPPPGPPPNVPRSQSMNRQTDVPSTRPPGNHASQPRTRQPPVSIGTNLDPIPPTPAGWTEQDALPSARPLRTPVGALHIDTLNLRRNRSPHIDTEISENVYSEITEPLTGATADSFNLRSETSTQTSSSGLFRSAAVRRDPSAKGIRERRSESRAGKERATADYSAASISSNPWADAMQNKPADLTLPPAEGGGGLVRRRTLTRSTPRSARNSKSPPTTGDSKHSDVQTNGSSHSTPKGESSRQPHLATHTPPFSPSSEPSSAAIHSRGVSPSIPPKALPTPPPQKNGESSYLGARSPSRDRPISHILHLKDDDSAMPTPLTPSRPSSRRSSTMGACSNPDGDSSFVREALERYRSILQQEESASSEREKLELFVEFVASESRIRRIQYATGFTDGSFDVAKARGSLFTPRSSSPPPRSAGLLGNSHRNGPPSPVSSIDLARDRPDSAWWNNYKPSLSPIASLSMSNDEMSSRGRAPSRWWESSQTGSEGHGKTVERSKRESKYMGLNKEVREQMQRDGNLPHTVPEEVPTYGDNEYPPEKVGWHEPSPQLPPPPPQIQYQDEPIESPKLDVSRLVTLPPPYPRHHPAVNNSHPDLANYRTLVRSVTDLSEVNAIKERCNAKIEAMQNETRGKIKASRHEFKVNIQSQIEAGSISYAEAAEAEQALKWDEHSSEKTQAQTEFDVFQEDVIKPVHDTLTARIHKTTFYIDELRSKLENDAQRRSPNLTQEEGDEQPETLEKLTLLKWLFEARESLHKEVYDLLSARNEKYKTIVLLPYRQTKNEEKIRGTEAFFTADAADRLVQFETEVHQRHESFMSVIEENVIRGVEEQLSAFWDIAPSLLELLQKIPGDLQNFLIQIPAEEYAENPSYRHHPLQYLYSLLSHAEKSTYQFIESQINLLCLLHEAKTGVMVAGCGLVACQRVKAGEDKDTVEAEMKETRRVEEDGLTGDLQEKVRTVEGQWREALGEEAEGCKTRVKEWLIQTGGWEERDEEAD